MNKPRRRDAGDLVGLRDAVQESERVMRGSALTLEKLLLSQGLIVGYDENDDTGGDDKGDADDNADDADDDSGEDDDDSGEDSDQDKAALQKALNKERKQRRDLEKANRKLEREQKKLADKDLDETERARTEATETKATNVKLAEKLQTTSVDNLITKHASKLKFRDLDDALKLVDRAKIVVDQDEDEPADIEVDEQSVIDALKTLTKAKPHLLLAAGDTEASGGNLGTQGNKNKQEMDEEQLRKKYPALRR